MNFDSQNFEIGFNGDVPSVGYTNEQWQHDFERIRSVVVPACDNKMDMGRVQRTTDSFTYDGKTQWQNYCTFINGILDYIRSGAVDYCFYVYQISELLRYEPDRLMSEWLKNDRCFKVWLNKP